MWMSSPVLGLRRCRHCGHWLEGPRFDFIFALSGTLEISYEEEPGCHYGPHGYGRTGLARPAVSWKK